MHISSTWFVRATGAALAAASLILMVTTAATAATPAPIPVTEATETPVEIHQDVNSNGSIIYFGASFYTVPAGKMLIVDSLTVINNQPGSATTYSVLLLNEAPGGLASYASASTGGGGQPFGTQSLHMHVTAGSTLSFNLNASVAAINAGISLSGHLVNMP